MRKSRRLILALAVLTAAYASSAFADPFKVNSGKVLDIVAIQEVRSGETRALAMRFATRTPLSDLFGLRAEADELWEHFVVNVEKGGYRRAVIRAQTAGAGKDAKMVEFVYLKRGSEWRTLEKGLGPLGRLTRSFVRARYDSSKHAQDYNNFNAMRLYLAADWTATYVYPPKFGLPPVVVRREEIMDSLRRMQTSDVGQEITKIVVSKDGKHARVLTRVKASALANGVAFDVKGKVTTLHEVRDGSVVATKSLYEYEDIVTSIDQ